MADLPYALIMVAAVGIAFEIALRVRHRRLAVLEDGQLDVPRLVGADAPQLGQARQGDDMVDAPPALPGARGTGAAATDADRPASVRLRATARTSPGVRGAIIVAAMLTRSSRQ